MTFLTKFDRWEPFEELTTLRNRMDRLWTRMTAEDTGVLADWSPTSDVIESKDEIVIKSELPGLDEKNVDIELEGGMLTIKGQRNAEKESEEKGYRRVERSYGSFARSIGLPFEADPGQVKATFAKGVLTVTVPKPPQVKAKEKKIPISGGR